ncbi:MAG TPA: cytochrome c oxidase subunit II [Elusimicrobiota bacterium]|nr:cytochrome c oxidase subunit II [Elusimicrobiota bacterium]
MWNFPLFPQQASTISGSVDSLFAFLMIIAVFFSALIAFLIVFFSVKYHHTSKADRTGGTGSHLLLEITWTVIPLCIVMVVFVWGTRVFYRAKVMPPDALEMYVVGKQWMWKIQHPEGQREINALHIPINVPIQLTMISEDVIHDFSIPAFRVKQDVIPGRYTKMWFQASRLGSYHIFCDQYCGTLHSSMVGTVYVMPPKEYEAWLANGGNSAAVGGSMATSGQELFGRMGCATCHLANGEGRGPSLQNLYMTKVTMDDGRAVVADDAYLRESILKPLAKVVRGYQPVMPLFQGQLSEADVLQLISYIKSLNTSAKPAASAVSKEP